MYDLTLPASFLDNNGLIVATGYPIVRLTGTFGGSVYWPSSTSTSETSEYFYPESSTLGPFDNPPGTRFSSSNGIEYIITGNDEGAGPAYLGIDSVDGSFDARYTVSVIEPYPPSTTTSSSSMTSTTFTTTSSTISVRPSTTDFACAILTENERCFYLGAYSESHTDMELNIYVVYDLSQPVSGSPYEGSALTTGYPIVRISGSLAGSISYPPSGSSTGPSPVYFYPDQGSTGHFDNPAGLPFSSSNGQDYVITGNDESFRPDLYGVDSRDGTFEAQYTVTAQQAYPPTSTSSTMSSFSSSPSASSSTAGSSDMSTSSTTSASRSSSTAFACGILTANERCFHMSAVSEANPGTPFEVYLVYDHASPVAGGSPYAGGKTTTTGYPIVRISGIFGGSVVFPSLTYTGGPVPELFYPDEVFAGHFDDPYGMHFSSSSGRDFVITGDGRDPNPLVYTIESDDGLEGWQYTMAVQGPWPPSTTSTVSSSPPTSATRRTDTYSDLTTTGSSSFTLTILSTASSISSISATTSTASTSRPSSTEFACAILAPEESCYHLVLTSFAYPDLEFDGYIVYDNSRSVNGSPYEGVADGIGYSIVRISGSMGGSISFPSMAHAEVPQYFYPGGSTSFGHFDRPEGVHFSSSNGQAYEITGDHDSRGADYYGIDSDDGIFAAEYTVRLQEPYPPSSTISTSLTSSAFDSPSYSTTTAASTETRPLDPSTASVITATFSQSSTDIDSTTASSASSTSTSARASSTAFVCALLADTQRCYHIGAYSRGNEDVPLDMYIVYDVSRPVSGSPYGGDARGTGYPIIRLGGTLSGSLSYPSFSYQGPEEYFYPYGYDDTGFFDNPYGIHFSSSNGQDYEVLGNDELDPKLLSIDSDDGSFSEQYTITLRQPYPTTTTTASSSSSIVSSMQSGSVSGTTTSTTRPISTDFACGILAINERCFHLSGSSDEEPDMPLDLFVVYDTSSPVTGSPYGGTMRPSSTGFPVIRISGVYGGSVSFPSPAGNDAPMPQYFYPVNTGAGHFDSPYGMHFSSSNGNDYEITSSDSGSDLYDISSEDGESVAQYTMTLAQPWPASTTISGSTAIVTTDSLSSSAGTITLYSEASDFTSSSSMSDTMLTSSTILASTTSVISVSTAPEGSIVNSSTTTFTISTVRPSSTGLACAVLSDTERCYHMTAFSSGNPDRSLDLYVVYDSSLAVSGSPSGGDAVSTGYAIVRISGTFADPIYLAAGARPQYFYPDASRTGHFDSPTGMSFTASSGQSFMISGNDFDASGTRDPSLYSVSYEVNDLSFRDQYTMGIGESYPPSTSLTSSSYVSTVTSIDNSFLTSSEIVRSSTVTSSTTTSASVASSPESTETSTASPSSSMIASELSSSTTDSPTSVTQSDLSGFPITSTTSSYDLGATVSDAVSTSSDDYTSNISEGTLATNRGSSTVDRSTSSDVDNLSTATTVSSSSARPSTTAFACANLTADERCYHLSGYAEDNFGQSIDLYVVYDNRASVTGSSTLR